jgi:hypothetical protein
VLYFSAGTHTSKPAEYQSHASTGAWYVSVLRLQLSAIVLAHVFRGKQNTTIIERMNNSDIKTQQWKTIKYRAKAIPRTFQNINFVPAKANEIKMYITKLL